MLVARVLPDGLARGEVEIVDVVCHVLAVDVATVARINSELKQFFSQKDQAHPQKLPISTEKAKLALCLQSHPKNTLYLLKLMHVFFHLFRRENKQLMVLEGIAKKNWL